MSCLGLQHSRQIGADRAAGSLSLRACLRVQLAVTSSGEGENLFIAAVPHQQIRESVPAYARGQPRIELSASL
jgi:hypothetical protein